MASNAGTIQSRGLVSARTERFLARIDRQPLARWISSANMFSMKSAINTVLANLDSAIATQERIIDTYEGMLSYCNDGEGADSILVYLDKAQAEKSRLEAEWNAVLLSSEAA